MLAEYDAAGPGEKGAVLRRHGLPLGEVVAAVDDAEQELLALRSRPALPAEPDRSWESR